MGNEQNIKIIDSLYKGFSTGNMQNVLGPMHPEIEWNEAKSNSLAAGNPYIGPNTILEGVFANLGAKHEYFGLNDIKIHRMDDNMVLATLRYDAKVKATGKSYNAQAAYLWTLNDEGKITAFQQFLDTKKVADSEA